MRREAFTLEYSGLDKKAASVAFFCLFQVGGASLGT